MQLFESAPVKVGAKSVIFIRVPDLVLADPMKAGAVMNQAETEFRRDVILVGADMGGKLGNPHLRRHFQNFDPQKAKWFQWNMAE
jgi:hypothetical protein